MSIYSLIADANKLITESMSTYNPSELEKKNESKSFNADMSVSIYQPIAQGIAKARSATLKYAEKIRFDLEAATNCKTTLRDAGEVTFGVSRNNKILIRVTFRAYIARGEKSPDEIQKLLEKKAKTWLFESYFRNFDVSGGYSVLSYEYEAEV